MIDLGAGQIGDLVGILAELAPVDVIEAQVGALGRARAVIIPGQKPIATTDAHSLVSSPALAGVARFAAAGGAVLAIGSGLQLVCAGGLLPGRLADSPGVEGAVHCVVEGRPSPFTWALPVGRCLTMGAVTPPYLYCCDDLPTLEEEGRVVLRFSSQDGDSEGEGNPAVEGGMRGVAGVCNLRGNVVGVIPQLGQGGISLLRSVIADRGGRSSRIPL